MIQESICSRDKYFNTQKYSTKENQKTKHWE